MSIVAENSAPPAFQQPNPDLQRIWLLIGLRWTLLLLIALGTPLYFLHWEWWKIVVAIAAVGLIGAVAARRSSAARFESTGWKLDESVLAVRSGGRNQSTVFIPRARIHYAEVGAGPMERRFGLAHLLVFVAGSETPAAHIRGLKPADADQLRRELLPPEPRHA